MAGDRVEIRSNHEYIGRPLAFYWHDKRYEVAEVLAQNRTPEGYIFRVQAVNTGTFELIYDDFTDQWSVHQL
jgi:hypothetical protein